MARTRRAHGTNPGELNLTAMIDVAFQLLSFFLLAIKPVDVFANLDALRPSLRSSRVSLPPPVEIMVLPQAPGETKNCVMNNVPLSMPQTEIRLQRCADTDPAQTVLIVCSKKSTHRQLIELLDVCAKCKLTNLSVVSSDAK